MKKTGSKKQQLPKIFELTAYLIFTMAFIYGIIIAKNFLYPIALAILFAYLLFPFANFFEKRLKFPRILANLLTIVLAIVFLAGGLLFLYKQLANLVQDLAALKERVLANISGLEQFIEQKFGVAATEQEQWLKQTVSDWLDNSNELFGRVFATTTGAIARIILLPIYVFFMLYYRDKFHDFLIRATNIENRTVVKRIIESISGVTQNYMGGVFIVVIILCFANSFGLYLVGLDYFIILGIIAAICNFIPYFGTILGFSFPLLFALITGEPHTALGVVIVFFIVQFTENNILTPNIVGGNVKLNPIVIILSLIVGAMIWGIPGMLVVVPFMAVMRIIAENVEKLHPLSFLLGVEGTEKHSVTFNKVRNLFLSKKRKEQLQSQKLKTEN